MGYNYRLYWDRTSESLGDCVGFTDFNNQSISIASNLPDDLSRFSVLLHEVIEAVNYHLELNLKHTQISGLEVGLYQTFRWNDTDIKRMLYGDKAN